LKLLTLARDLKRRKSRDKHRLFVAEGIRAVEELLRSALTIKGVLVAPQIEDSPRGQALAAQIEQRGLERQAVDAREFASAAETDAPQGVMALAEIPNHAFTSLSQDWRGILVVLDGVQDPGNVGTILRTAAALGARATIALPGTVDLWNAKVVRSGMGAHFKHLAFSATWDELDAMRREHDTRIVAADAGGVPVTQVTRAERMALVVGNEGAGLSTDSRQRADQVVALSISRDIESLNVAVATGILLYALTQ
jgi:TrmH family RNA methyltransferase